MMSDIFKTSLSSIMASIVVGVVLWWGVVETRLAKAETNISVNAGDIEEVKIASREDNKELKNQIQAIDEKITRVLFLLTRQ